MSRYRVAKIVVFLLFIINSYLNAQWNNNPQANKILVTGTKKPLNISTTVDNNGGGFIFWEDKTDSINSNIYFQHFTEDGMIDFRADGKQISKRLTHKNSAISCASSQLTSVVIYKDYGNNKSGDLYVQKVSNRGDLLWTDNGKKITDFNGDAIDPSIASDFKGNIFVSYIYRDYNTPANYHLYVQKLKTSGDASYKDNGLLVIQSSRIKSRPKLTVDSKGGAYIFWVESNEGKARLNAQHIDSTGRLSWGTKPISVSGLADNVLGYTVQTIAGDQAYVTWEVKKTNKDIYQQLISIDGRSLWSRDGKRVTNQYGSQTYPQAIYTDSTIILSWINEASGDKDIYIQKFNMRGEPLWAKDGIPVIKMNGNQLSQRLIPDYYGGTIISWIDMRVKAQKGTIFAQRLNKEGNRLWDTTGIELAANINSEKSYLSLLPNKINGAVAIFKENRANKNNLYGQRILGNGRFNFDILGFKAIVDNNLVKLSWQTNNESENKGFYVERINIDTNWQQVKFVPGKNLKGYNSYNFSESLPAKGVVFYRLIQVDSDGNVQRSNIVRLDNINLNSSNFILVQNYPNPFSDSTIIKYFLPEKCRVVLEIYNDKIETIKVAVDEVQNRGEYSIPFSVEKSSGKLKSGVYFYRLKAGDFVDVKKMVIVR
ncbi:MAG: hypothetical protein WCJ01_02120 [Ignavibacteria bacterium]